MMRGPRWGRCAGATEAGRGGGRAVRRMGASGMASRDELRGALGRLVDGTAGEGDRRLVGDALEAGRIVVATGERAVALGGDASDAVIATGDGAVIQVFRGADAEAARGALN